MWLDRQVVSELRPALTSSWFLYGSEPFPPAMLSPRLPLWPDTLICSWKFVRNQRREEEARQLIIPYKLQKKTFETASSYSERHPGDCQLLGRGVSSGRGCLGIVKRLLLSGDTHVWSCRVLECHSLTRQGFALWQLASVVLTKRRCRLVFSCSRLRLPPSLRASAKTFAVEWDINSVKHTSGSLSSPASSSDLDWLQTLGW